MKNFNNFLKPESRLTTVNVKGRTTLRRPMTLEVKSEMKQGVENKQNG